MTTGCVIYSPLHISKSFYGILAVLVRITVPPYFTQWFLDFFCQSFRGARNNRSDFFLKCPTSCFISWYLSPFFFSFSNVLTSLDTAISIIEHFLLDSNNIWLSSIILSHCMMKYQKSFTHLFSTTVIGLCSYQFSALSPLYLTHYYYYYCCFILNYCDNKYVQLCLHHRKKTVIILRVLLIQQNDGNGFFF